MIPIENSLLPNDSLNIVNACPMLTLLSRNQLMFTIRNVRRILKALNHPV